jgi:hypothetical protein
MSSSLRRSMAGFPFRSDICRPADGGLAVRVVRGPG